MIRMIVSMAVIASYTVYGMLEYTKLLESPVVLPQKDIIARRIKPLILPANFDTQKLVTHLASKAKVSRVKHVLDEVGASIILYNCAFQSVEGISQKDKNMVVQYMNDQRPKLIRAILQDDWRLLVKLREAKLL